MQLPTANVKDNYIYDMDYRIHQQTATNTHAYVDRATLEI